MLAGNLQPGNAARCNMSETRMTITPQSRLHSWQPLPLDKVPAAMISLPASSPREIHVWLKIGLSSWRIQGRLSSFGDGLTDLTESIATQALAISPPSRPTNGVLLKSSV